MLHKLIGSFVMVAIVLVSLLGAPLAQAAEPTTAPQAAEAMHHGGHHHRAGRALMSMGLLKATANVTGLSLVEVREQVQSGQTLTQVAEASGATGDAVVQEFTGIASLVLDIAVADGKITEEQAERMLERMEENATELVNDAELGERMAQGEERLIFAGLVRATADVTDLPFFEVAQRVRSGETLAQIAEAEGSTTDAVLQDWENVTANRMANAVEVGIITQDEADQLQAIYRDIAAGLMTETPELGEPRGDNPGPRRGR